jgi:hypothetical protein
MIYAELVLRELLTRPISAAAALVELPLTMRRSLEEANQLMETSRRQLEQMQRQTDDALDQAERMNELLSRFVRLTEPLEKAQRGGEYAAEIARRVIFGEEEHQLERVVEEEKKLERAVEEERKLERAEEPESGATRVIPNQPPPAE